MYMHVSERECLSSQVPVHCMGMIKMMDQKKQSKEPLVKWKDASHRGNEMLSQLTGRHVHSLYTTCIKIPRFNSSWRRGAPILSHVPCFFFFFFSAHRRHDRLFPSRCSSNEERRCVSGEGRTEGGGGGGRKERCGMLTVMAVKPGSD